LNFKHGAVFFIKQTGQYVMEISRDKTLFFLRQAAEIKWTKIFFADSRPLPPPGIIGSVSGIGRFIIPLTHSKRIIFAENGKIEDHIFTPGEVLVCRSHAWTADPWDRRHTMVSVSFMEHFIRAIYISHDGVPKRPEGPDIFFHTASPLNAAGAYTLQAVWRSSKNSKSILYNFQALLAIIIEALENYHDQPHSKEDFTWGCIQDFIETNYRMNITRESISEALRIHPAHLSRLVRKKAKCTINEYLTRLRMEYAVRLLEDKTISIDEVADQCGYTYTSYFIKVFRRYYIESPACYRENLQKRLDTRATKKISSLHVKNS
jgi:AraC-like DNA-binding protein